MKQLTLFPANAYLETKFDPHIFSDAPNAPGVYRFYNKNGELIYAGKSKNLRKRLYSYKRIKPGSASRKVSALVSNISSAEFTIFDTETEAILEENRLIRKHRPTYNHANKQIETYYFIRIVSMPGGIFFMLSMNELANVESRLKGNHLFAGFEQHWRAGLVHNRQSDWENVYGCFKGHVRVRTSFGALLQLLWMLHSGVSSPGCLPPALTRNLAPFHYLLPVDPSLENKRMLLLSLLDQWFTGRADSILNLLMDLIPRAESSFSGTFLNDRLEELQSFYKGTLLKHRQIRDVYGLPEDQIIRQDELDDFLVSIAS